MAIFNFEIIDENILENHVVKNTKQFDVHVEIIEPRSGKTYDDTIN